MSCKQIIITVSGVDKTGIVAAVAAVLAEYKVNIEDIKQTLMQGHFVMFMLCDISNAQVPFKDIKNALNKVGEKLDMELWVQCKEIFDNMHNM